MARLFVYGTLRCGQGNNYLLKNSQLIHNQILISGYEIRANQHYPYAFFNPERKITGDIYEVSQTYLETVLDELEDTASAYYIRYFDAKNQFYIYVKGTDNREDYSLIESGDWVEYERNKNISN